MIRDLAHCNNTQCVLQTECIRFQLYLKDREVETPYPYLLIENPDVCEYFLDKEQYEEI